MGCDGGVTNSCDDWIGLLDLEVADSFDHHGSDPTDGELKFASDLPILRGVFSDRNNQDNKCAITSCAIYSAEKEAA
jgi:hypothetical protein